MLMRGRPKLKLHVVAQITITALLVAAVLPLACKRERVISGGRGPDAAARVSRPAPRPAPPPRLAPKVRYEVVFGERCRIVKVRPCSFEGLHDRSYRSVFVRHEKLPEGRLTFTFPEGIRFHPLCGQDGDVAWSGGRALREPDWIAGTDHLSYVQHWRPGGKHGDLRLKVAWRITCAGPDSMGVELVLTNQGNKLARFVEPSVCLAADKNSCSGLSTFFKRDRSTARRFHTRAGWVKFAFVAQIAIEGVSYKEKRGCYKKDVQATTGLVLTENVTNGWLMGLGWDRARTLSIGAQDCIHSHPLVQNLRPGETVTRKGRVYLTRATKGALLKRYHKELGKD